MKFKLISKPIVFGLIMMIISPSQSFAQDYSAAIASADTIHFSVNKTGGWQLFNSYVNRYKTDSVQFELILQHTKNINWNQDQYVGKIKYDALLPATTKEATFNLLNNVYTLRIQANGKCYMKLTSGSIPNQDPAIIPFKIYYKQ